MKTMKLLVMTLFSFLMIGMLGCEKEETNKEYLKKTKWQLSEYVNISTGVKTKAEPEGDGYYTITFDTDTTATGHSILNVIIVSLNVPSIYAATEIDDSMNGNAVLFYEAIKSIESYILEGDQLKFYYNGKQQYLLFKRQES